MISGKSSGVNQIKGKQGSGNYGQVAYHDWYAVVKKGEEGNMWEVIAKYYCIDWIALVLTATAIYLLGKKRKTGFSLGVGANIVWIAFGILAHSVASVFASIILIILNVKGWRNWTIELKSNKPDVVDC